MLDRVLIAAHRFLSGEAVAVERALWLGGPIALSEALRDLPRA